MSARIRVRAAPPWHPSRSANTHRRDRKADRTRRASCFLPLQKRGAASMRSSVGNSRLCRGHNSAIAAAHSPTVDATTATVANHASRVRPADACSRDCIGAAWQPVTVAPMLRPRRNVCAAPLAPGHPREGGQAPDRTPAANALPLEAALLHLDTDFELHRPRTAPAMERSRARRRDEWTSSNATTRPAARWVPAIA